MATQIAVDTTYDRRGNIATVSAPAYLGIDAPEVTSFSYDGLDRLTRQTLPDGHAVTTSRATGGGAGTVFQTVTTSEPLSAGLDQATRVERDARGRTVTRIRVRSGAAVDAVTRYGYDVLGRLTGLSDPLGNAWRYDYDGAGRRTDLFDPDLGHWSFACDNLDRLLSADNAGDGDLSRIYRYDLRRHDLELWLMSLGPAARLSPSRSAR